MARFALRHVVAPLLLAGTLWTWVVQPGWCQTPSITPPSEELTAAVLDPTQLIAQVGDQPIFAADMLPTVDQLLQEYVGKVPEDQLRRQRAMFVQQMLPRKIEVKLVLLDFLRTIPADKQREVLANIDKQVEKQYYDEQVPATMEQLQVKSLAELETRLRSFGTTIQKQKDEFREQMLARQLIGQKINRYPEITHDQLLDYYHEHSKDYDVPARAQWEQLTARFDKFPDKAAADRAIVEMGNQVLNGAKFSAVAKKFSQDPNAAQGGFHDWIRRGSLVSQVLDTAIFTLPIGHLSLKLEDAQGYHIVRVINRQEAARVSFLDAQQEIRETLQEENRKEQVREYIEKLRTITYVWTIFDSGATTQFTAAQR